jgi:hypothetical protein
LHFKKKTAVVTAATVGVVVAGTAAWAYVTIGGSGAGNATTAANDATLSGLTATAAITDLDVPATITVKAASSKKNRHISSVTIALDADDLPTGCKAEWFTFSNGAATAANQISTAPAWNGHTFATIGEETLADPSLGITLANASNAKQDACLAGSIPLTVTAS